MAIAASGAVGAVAGGPVGALVAAKLGQAATDTGVAVLGAAKDSVKWSWRIGLPKNERREDQDVREVLDAVNRMLTALHEAYQRRLLLLVDGLDRASAERIRVLFVESALLGDLVCDAVWTAPRSVRRLHDHETRGFEAQELCDVPVLSRDDPRQPGVGLGFFRALVAKRIAAVNKALPAPGPSDPLPEVLVDRLAYYSGGLSRDFVRMVRIAAGEAWEVKLESLTDAVVDFTLREARRLKEAQKPRRDRAARTGHGRSGPPAPRRRRRGGAGRSTAPARLPQRDDMVPPPPAADPGAARAPAWLGKLIRQFEHARRGVLVALTEARSTQLGAVVRALSTAPPWAERDEGVLEVCLRADQLLAVSPGSRVLLRVRVDDLEWLNLNRPLFADRELRAALWLDEPALDGMVRSAVDLFDWVSRVVPVPAKPLPDFAVAGVRTALQARRAFAWTEGPLAQALAAAGCEQVVSIDGDASFEQLLAQLGRPELPIIEGLRSEHDAWRVRMALAWLGRDTAWVALRPQTKLAGLVRLGAEQADWDRASAQLRDQGYRHPALLAAWCELNPEHIAGLVEHPGASPDAWAPAPADEEPVTGLAPQLAAGLAALGDELPSVALVDMATGGFDDVAAALARIRWERGADERSDRWVTWLIDHGDMRRALEVTQIWLERRASDSTATAAALAMLGRIHEARAEARLATDALTRALAIYDELVAREPERDELQRKLATTLALLGKLWTSLGQHERGRASLERALEVARGLVERAPADLANSVSLATAHAQLGELELQRGALTSATAHLREAEELLRAALARAPDDVELRHLLAEALLRLGHASLASGDRDDARRRLQASEAIARALAERDPSRRNFERGLLQASLALAELDPPAPSALARLDQAVEAGRLRAQRAPDDIGATLEAARDLGVLGRLHDRVANPEAARACYAASVELLQPLVGRAPDLRPLRHLLAVSLLQLGVHEHETTRALPHLRGALDQLQALVKDDPDDRITQHELAAARAALGARTNDRELLLAARDWFVAQKTKGALLPRFADFADLLVRTVVDPE